MLLFDLFTMWAVVFLFPQRADILDELQKSQKVFAEKLNHLSRRLAWINATVYSKVGVCVCVCVCVRACVRA